MDIRTVSQPDVNRKLFSASNLKILFSHNKFFNTFSVIYMFIAQHIEIDFFYWVQDFSYITRKSPNEAHSALSLLRVVTISLTNHNQFVFWTWNVSYQMPSPTTVFKSSHNSPIPEFGRNETLAKSRKSIMRSTEHYWTHRDLLVNWESGWVRLSDFFYS